MEAERFEGFIKVLCILQGRSFSIDYNVFLFSSRVLKLNHPVLFDLSFLFFWERQCKFLIVLLIFFQKFVEDNFVHGTTVVMTHLHEQGSTFHLFDLFGFGQGFESSFLLLIDFGKIGIDKGHVVDIEFVADYAVSIDSQVESVFDSGDVFSGVFSIEAKVDSFDFTKLVIFLPNDFKLFVLFVIV